MLTGLNHLTLAVTDVERSVAFYTDLLGCKPATVWDGGAYLTLGALWICLSLDPARAVVPPQADYTHYAFTIAEQDFAAFRARLLLEGVIEWRKNRSEGDSFYFLDPDGHQLEAHAGDLQSRLAACRLQPYAGMRFFD
ncbi:fosfomycin resistance glutathione transferase [Herbaspirillum sp. SJZ107]|uniref:fosfomycin resistance glutathione transferase n=1 Tax=Herbaspirillum sp. SJZ107 TaxID=2572881 RepID=UPI001152B739|nr:fosfomycin resistance glutathione transferase [Herbaspirillum sp. SJZ107]TQK07572.1 catechol 2,3-dioxygenase-like lactoylglutathione lyase family enzyme [Herbaspirillum sp. SJZ107]